MMQIARGFLIAGVFFAILSTSIAYAEDAYPYDGVASGTRNRGGVLIIYAGTKQYLDFSLKSTWTNRNTGVTNTGYLKGRALAGGPDGSRVFETNERGYCKLFILRDEGYYQISQQGCENYAGYNVRFEGMYGPYR